MGHVRASMPAVQHPTCAHMDGAPPCQGGQAVQLPSPTNLRRSASRSLLNQGVWT